MSYEYSVAVIGGGASGLMSAITAARTAEKLKRKVKIVIFEGKPDTGKKILATGNGRCNLTNRNISVDNYFGSVELFAPVYSQFDNDKLIDFFISVGMPVRTDYAGRVYPLSNQASSVLSALQNEILRLGITCKCETKVFSVKNINERFLINDEYIFDKCILACGGKAQSVHGSDGSGYALLKTLGIKYKRIFPALTPIVISDFSKSLKGIRAEGKITSMYNGKALSTAEGELQYTDYGLSGIPSMQISRTVSELINITGINNVDIEVDTCPSFSENDLKNFLLNFIKLNPDLPCNLLLAGLMPKKLGIYLITASGINPDKPVSSLSDKTLDLIINSVKSMKYTATGVKGFNDAQVTSGGVSSDELYIDTLKTKKISGLFICGELVDIDGDCGGYNLQWAFSSGYVAGKNSVLECK